MQPTIRNSFAATVSQSDYDELFLAKSEWEERMGPEVDTPILTSQQVAWDIPICKKSLDHLISRADTQKDRARLLACNSEHASDWLNPLPIPSLGLKLDNSQVRIACALRLGSPMCHPHTCTCGTEVNHRGTHGLSCKKSSGRFPRHAQVNDIIKRALHSANFPAVIEPTGVSRTDGKRPDGMTIFPWKKGRFLVWDYTCSDTLAPSHLPISSVNPGKMAENAESAKLKKYSNMEEAYSVIPICVETMGPWGQNGLGFIKELGNKIKNVTKEPKSTAYLCQAISVAIQRGNAASILGTVPPTKNLEEIYNL